MTEKARDVDLRRVEEVVNDAAEQMAERASAVNERARREAAMVSRYHGARRADNHRAWCEFHSRQAALFESLAAEHRRALGRLLEGGA